MIGYAALPPSVQNNYPIPLVSKVKKIDKVDGTDADKSEWIKLEFLMDPENLSSKYSLQFAIFKDGCPGDWIKSVMPFRDIENLIPLKEPADKTRMFRTLMESSLESFDHHLRRG
jgi:hypothetical protein